VESGTLFPVARDFVDWVIERWAAEVPDLDTSSIAVVGRLLRIVNLLEPRFEQLCREEGISFWAFVTLNALRRSGPPDALTPSQLRSAGMVSGAAVTKRVAKLEELDLVERIPDPRDARGALIGLTPAGRTLIDRLGTRYLEEERAVIAPLDVDQQATLADLLRQMLLGLEGPRTGPTPPKLERSPR
jgi:DNA-binding MarR family transcriptional regulator